MVRALLATLLAAPGAASGAEMSPSVQSVVRFLGCTLTDDTTVACASVDGAGQTVFWLTLSDHTTVAAAFAWPVRPGAVPTPVRTVRVRGADVSPIPSTLRYVWPSLDGSLPLPEGPVSVALDLKPTRAIQGATGRAEVSALLQGTGLRLAP